MYEELEGDGRGPTYKIYKTDKDGRPVGPTHYILGVSHPATQLWTDHLREQVAEMVAAGKIAAIYNEVAMSDGFGDSFEARMHADLKDLPLPTGGRLAWHGLEKRKDIRLVYQHIHDFEAKWKILKLAGRPRRCQKTTPRKRGISYRTGCEGLMFYAHFTSSWPGFFCSEGRSCRRCRPYVELIRHNLEVTLYSRNERWVKNLHLDDLAAPVLIAPGAMHLYGSRGLVKLLRDRGWTVGHYDGIQWPTRQDFEDTRHT